MRKGHQHDELFEWLMRVLESAAIPQNAGAHHRAGRFAEMTRGVPAASTHPFTGWCPVSDDILSGSNINQGSMAVFLHTGADVGRSPGRPTKVITAAAWLRRACSPEETVGLRC